jgi:hypothetical protein
MNTDLKNLRVYVIPTEEGHSIDQSSSVEEIMNCEAAKVYSVYDYFKAQNDEEHPMHWSFIIDIEKKVDMTGCNTDGVDMNSKASKIAVIKRIIEVWGATSSCELELDASPCLSSTGSNKNNISQLIEDFNYNHVVVYSYHNELELNHYEIPYEDLREDLIDEIHQIMLDYEKQRGDEEAEKKECIENDTHLKDCDDDGFCNHCGYQ